VTKQAGDRQQGAGKLTRRRFLKAAAGAGAFLFSMPTSFAVTNAGTKAATNFEPLGKRVQGDLSTAASSQFNPGALLWNARKPSRQPAAVVAARDVNDVVAAVEFAADNDLKVSVRGGGHNFYGLALRQGGVLIDLGNMRSMSVDPQSGLAFVQPGVSNIAFARELAAHNLAFPVGHCPSVPMSGYLLNGGIAFNLGGWGPACESVEAVDLVLADGSVVRADKENHEELYWTARGAGPGLFAVAVGFHVRTYPQPAGTMMSTYFCSLDKLQEVTQAVARLAADLPAHTELLIGLITAPPTVAAAGDNPQGRVCMVQAVVFGESAAESTAALSVLENEPLLSSALCKKVNHATTLEELLQSHEHIFPAEHRYEVELFCSNSPAADVLMAVKDHVLQTPSAKSMAACILSTGKQPLLRPLSGMAFSLSGNLIGGCWTIWDKAEDDERNLSWFKTMTSLLRPFTLNHYIGETDIVDEPSRAERSFADQNWRRLERLRAKYDRHGRFFDFGQGLT
jgi:FAD/FMN-containing dehydrogenase